MEAAEKIFSGEFEDVMDVGEFADGPPASKDKDSPQRIRMVVSRVNFYKLFLRH